MEEQILKIISKNYQLDYNLIKNHYYSILKDINNDVKCVKIVYKNDVYYIDKDNNVYKHIVKDNSGVIGKYIGKYINNEIII